jgi:HEAT repeat protein
MSQLPLFFYDPAKQPWFWQSALTTVGVLLLLNVGLLAFIYVRRLRGRVRARRAARFVPRLEPLLDQLVSEAPPPEVVERLTHLVAGLDDHSRPLAATMLIDRLRPADPETRARARKLLRQAGAVDLMLRGIGRSAPWRRALSVRALGFVGEAEAVPVVVERLDDRDGYVREAAVRALGRIRNPGGLLPLEQLFLDPKSKVASGFVYEALIAFGEAAAPVFRQGLVSRDEHQRVASCFGIAAVLEPESARTQLVQRLGDDAASVRAAALTALCRVGGTQPPAELARLTRDEQRSVRRAAATCLGTFDDERALELLLEFLHDPDRDTVIRTGESLVHLSRLPRVGAAARAALSARDDWPVERARTMASLGAV